MELRATKMISTGCDSSCLCKRKLSRNKRRARLRTIAPPIFLLVTTPNLGSAPTGSLCQLAMRQPSDKRSPRCRRRAKSRLCRMRNARPKPRRCGLEVGEAIIETGADMARKKSNWREPFATNPTAISQGGLATLGGIAVQKSVLTFTADLRRLILAFHKFKLNYFRR